MTGQQVDVLSAPADPLPCACIWLLAGALSTYCPLSSDDDSSPPDRHTELLIESGQ